MHFLNIFKSECQLALNNIFHQKKPTSDKIQYVQSFFEEDSTKKKFKKDPSSVFQSLKEGKAVCISSHKASRLCLNESCKFHNQPFICDQQKCQCLKHHEKCMQKRIDQFIRILENEDRNIKKISEIIDKEMQEINNYMISCKHDLIQELKEKRLANKLQKVQPQEEQKKYVPDDAVMAQNLILGKSSPQVSEEKVSSKLFAEMWKKSKQLEGELEENKIEKRLKLLTYPILNQLDKWHNKATASILKKQSFYWDYKWDRTAYKVDGYRVGVSSQEKVYQDKIILYNRWLTMSPSLSEVDQRRSIISWKIKIISILNVIGFGILHGIRQQNSSIPKRKKVYCMIDNYFYQAQFEEDNKSKSNQNKTDIQIKAGDVVKVDFDKSKLQLKFTHERTKAQFSYKILQKLKQNEDFWITLTITNPGDEAEFIPCEIDQSQKMKQK